jgi:hypothetical protein
MGFVLIKKTSDVADNSQLNSECVLDLILITHNSTVSVFLILLSLITHNSTVSLFLIIKKCVSSSAQDKGYMERLLNWTGFGSGT